MNDLLTEISTASVIPAMPDRNQVFDAINPFPEYASIKTSAECGVCRWGSWVAREILGNPLTHEFLIGGGRVLCPLFIGFAGFKRSACQGIIDQQWGESILPLITD